jgi:hypothetical protein
VVYFMGTYTQLMLVLLRVDTGFPIEGSRADSARRESAALLCEGAVLQIMWCFAKAAVLNFCWFR